MADQDGNRGAAGGLPTGAGQADSTGSRQAGADEVTVLRNSLAFEKAKTEILVAEVNALEDQVAEGLLAQYGDVITNETRDFWREELIRNRDGAVAALESIAAVRGGLPAAAGAAAPARRPLHNRATARPVVPAVGGTGTGPAVGSGVAAAAEDRAAKIRNRAQELSRTERVPFSAAFRRAEREVGG